MGRFDAGRIFVTAQPRRLLAVRLRDPQGRLDEIRGARARGLPRQRRRARAVRSPTASGEIARLGRREAADRARRPARAMVPPRAPLHRRRRARHVAGRRRRHQPRHPGRGGRGQPPRRAAPRGPARPGGPRARAAAPRVPDARDPAPAALRAARGDLPRPGEPRARHAAAARCVCSAAAPSFAASRAGWSAWASAPSTCGRPPLRPRAPDPYRIHEWETHSACTQNRGVGPLADVKIRISSQRDRRDDMDATDLCYTPATELAAMIRARSLSPVELTRAVLERIERLNPRVNAFCTLTAEAAMARAREAEADVMAGRAARADPRHPVLHQGPHVHARGAHDGRLAHLRRPGARRRRRLRAPSGRRGRDLPWQDHHAGVRLEGDRRQPGDRHHAEPVERGDDDRRVERGRGGGGRRRARALAPGLGRRGLHPDPLGVLRRVRPQAVVRTGAAVAGVQQRPDHPQRPP